MANGVEIRPNSIRIKFVFEGKTHKPTLMVEGEPMLPTPANIKYANRLAVEIRERIKHAVFSMAEYFPASGGGAAPITVGEQLDTWLAGMRIEFATRKSYESSVRFWKGAPIDAAGVMPMGALPLRALRHSHILTALASKPLAKGKTINNLMSVLRSACDLAMTDKLLTENPTSEVKAAKSQRPPPDPFSAEEAARIIAALTERCDPQERNYFEFKFFTGLRSSEAIALRWANVDFARGEIVISEAIVRGKAKASTKTNFARVVKLNSRALAVLQRQKAHTFLSNDEGDGAVFHCPNTGKAWTREEHMNRRFWAPTLKRLGIRYRVPYSTRHTYATMMLMAGMRPAFCARQMGHSLEVFIRVYARWLDGASDDLEMDRLEQSFGAKKSPEGPQPSPFGQVLPMKTR